jgi:DNA-binding transcriptional ArsR family regulator
MPLPTVDTYHAIADPNRRRLLDLLRPGELPVQALVEQFDVSFAAVSQHLRVLREAGLVTRRAQGRSRLYQATPAALKEVNDWTSQYREYWQGRIRRLNAYLDRTR